MASRGANEMLEKLGKIEEEKKFSRQIYFRLSLPFLYIFPCGGEKQFRLVSEAAARFLSVRLFPAVSQGRSRVCSNFGDLLLTLRDPLSSKTSVFFPFLQLSPPYPSEEVEFTKNIFMYYIGRKPQTMVRYCTDRNEVVNAQKM